MLIERFTVQSPNVAYTEEAITSTYDYASTSVSRTPAGEWVVEPTNTRYQFKVDRRVPKLG
jgi:myo-inositol-1-phosphate synthase